MKNRSKNTESRTPTTHAEPPDLSRFNTAYQAVKPWGRDDVPDGTYRARIESLRLDYSKNGDDMLRWNMVVLSGEHANRHVFKNAVITDASLGGVKGDLELLGLKLAEFDELPNRLDELIGLELEITVRTKDDRTNVYFKKRI